MRKKSEAAIKKAIQKDAYLVNPRLDDVYILSPVNDQEEMHASFEKVVSASKSAFISEEYYKIYISA